MPVSLSALRGYLLKFIQHYNEGTKVLLMISLNFVYPAIVGVIISYVLDIPNTDAFFMFTLFAAPYFLGKNKDLLIKSIKGWDQAEPSS